MDEDVKLSVEQAHEKWMTKMVVLVAALFLGTIAFWVHDCNVAERGKTCSEAVIVIRCPDARQKLTFPTGWTWARCSCPEAP